MKRPRERRVARVLCLFLERTQYRLEEYAKILKSLTRAKQVSYHCLNKSRLHVPYSHVESTPQNRKLVTAHHTHTAKKKAGEIPSISLRVYHRQMSNILGNKRYQ